MFDYSVQECPWYYFDSSYKTLLGACLFVFGVSGLVLNVWLFVTFLHSHLLVFKSHILVLNLCTAELGRNFLGFPFSGSSALAKRWLFGQSCCQFYAFTNQFFGVFQMSALFVIVLERYLLAKSTRRGRELEPGVYWTFVGFCWLISVIFSTPPLYGYGAYSCDETDTCCTLVWPSTDSSPKHFGFIIPYVIICGFLPIIAIFHYMGKTVRLEKIYYRSHVLKEEKHLTECIHTFTVATFTLWIPAFVLACWQWFPQLLYGYRSHVPPALVLIGVIASEAATCVPVICFLLSEDRLRAALLGRIKKNYALLHPVQAKKFMKV